MDLHAALLTRRTVQRFTSEVVPEATLTRALQAAHHAPCHRLTWPWRFTVVGPEGREALVQQSIAMKASRLDGSVERAEVAVRSKLGSATAVILVSQVLAADPYTREEDYAATACAVQNLMLSLHAEGFGSKWSTGGLLSAPESYQLCGIDPAAERLVGCLSIGRPVDGVKAPPRPELSDVVRRTR